MVRSFLKNAFVYALGDLLLLASGIVLLPLYTRWLSQSEFGSLELLERVGELLAIALVLRGVPQGVIVLHRQARSDEERGRVLGAGVLLALASAAIGTAFLALLAALVSDGLQLPSGTLLSVAVLASLVEGVAIVIQAANQARTESTIYVTVALGLFLTKVLLCIVLVAFLGWGIWGVVAASLVRALLFAVVLIGREWRRGMLWPDRDALRELLHFAWPFVPTGLCFFVLNSADRFFLVRYVDQAEIGIYGLGYRLATLAGMVSMAPLFRVWSARMHDVARTPQGPRAFARMATYLLGAYLFAGLGLCLFQHDCVRLLAGDAYAASGAVVAPVVLAYGFCGASTLFDAAFYVMRQTRFKIRIALASTVIMLALYITLIPTLGLLGAALATLGGFICHATLTYWVAQGVFAVPYEFSRLAAMLAVAVGIWLASLGLGEGWALAPVRLALWLLWPVFLWLSGLTTDAERRRLRVLLARLLGRRRLRLAGAMELTSRV